MIVNENRDGNWELAYAGTIKIYFTPEFCETRENIFICILLLSAIKIKKLTAQWKWDVSFGKFYFISLYGTCVKLNARDEFTLSSSIVDLEEMNENISAKHEWSFYFVDKLLRWNGHHINICRRHEKS